MFLYLTNFHTHKKWVVVWKNNFNVKLQTADATKIPYKDKYFDYVLSFAMLHHLKDVNKGVKEIYRVLKAGGQAYITVWNKLQPKFIFSKKETYVKWGKEDRYYHFVSFIELRKILKDNNFTILKSKLLGENLEFLVEKGGK